MVDAKGSLRHIRWYVNEGAGQLNAALFTGLPSLVGDAKRGRLDWVSPLSRDHYQECWNERFLERLDLERYLDDFQAFWPFSGQGTPHWDAVARVPGRERDGVVLIEAKAHRGEFLKTHDR